MESTTIRFKENVNKKNLGLEKEGRSKFPGCYDVIQPARGVDGRWITGLDEHSKAIRAMGNTLEKDKLVAEITKERKDLEALLNVDLSATSTFWENFYVKIDPNQPLDIANPLDRVKYRMLLATDSVAPSLQATLNMKYKDAKYFISREFEEMGDKVTKRKKIAEAGAKLLELIKTPDKAITIGRYLDLQVSSNMPQDNLFDVFQNYIDNDDTLNSIDKFLYALSVSAEEIGIKNLFRLALKFKVIRFNKGLYQRGEITLGKSVDEVVSWLSDINHSGELVSIQEEVTLKEKYG